MKDLPNTPLWVKLVYASIPTRNIAMWMIVSCVIFGIYCVPWEIFVTNPIVSKLFVINDWTWAGSMLPLTIWYWLALKWVDKHQAWED